MKKRTMNYCVGHYWDETDAHEDSQLSIYTYHNEVHFGTLKDAKKFQKYVQKQCPNDVIRIFKLVEIPE